MKALSLQNLKDVLDLSTWMILEARICKLSKGPEKKGMLRSNKLHLDFTSETQGHLTWMNMKVWDLIWIIIAPYNQLIGNHQNNTSRIGSMKVDQACRASNRGFRTELFKKSAGAVRQVILSCDNFSDDELVTKLRSCFSHAPTMNEAREDLRNMWQMEHEAVSVYMYRWGHALYRSSGIRPSEERHPHVIKDFISSLKKNIRNKIANRWAKWDTHHLQWRELLSLHAMWRSNFRSPIVQIGIPIIHSRDINEISAEETSGDEQEVTKSQGKNG